MPGAGSVKRFGATAAVDQVSLDIPRVPLPRCGAERLRENTLLRLIAGVTGPDGGAIYHRRAAH